MISQVAWFERKFDFNFPVGYFPVIVERLRGTLPRIENLIKGRPERELILKPAGQWSVKEHIGHLADLEPLWLGRIDDFSSGEQTLRPADLLNRKTHEANHNEQAIEDLLRLFSEERGKLIQKVTGIDEGIATRTSLHPRLQTPMRLIDSLFFVAEHDDHHLAKMRELVRVDSR